MNIKEKQTIWVLEGRHANNTYLHELVVNKVFVKMVEENYISQNHIGTKKVTVSKEMIDNAEGLEKLRLISGPIERTLHIISQGIEKKDSLHYFVSDKDNNFYDISSKHQTFLSKEDAMTSYKIQMNVSFSMSLDFYDINKGIFPDSKLIQCEKTEPILNIGRRLTP